MEKDQGCSFLSNPSRREEVFLISQRRGSCLCVDLHVLQGLVADLGPQEMRVTECLWPTTRGRRVLGPG